MLQPLTNIDISAPDIIKTLKTIPKLARLYETKVRHYLLEDHTTLVINQYDLHFTNVYLPIERSLFRFLLAIHDLGKPIAHREGKWELQHLHTTEILREIKAQLPFSHEEIDLCLRLIDGDPIGRYMQGY